MQLTEKHKEYWNRNLKITALLLAIWFIVTFVVSFYARYMNNLDNEYGVHEGEE